MIKFLKWTLIFLKSLWPLLLGIKWSIGGIWNFIKTLAMYPGAVMLLQMEPVLEQLIYTLTGIKGPVSWFIQKIIDAGLNYVISHVTGFNPQVFIDQIPSNVANFACYIGVTASLQILFSGILTGMATILQLELTVLAFKIKTALYLRMR